MAKPAVRLQVVEMAMLLGFVLLAGRAAQVQLVQGRRWSEEAQAQRTERIVLAARRGSLVDRHGTPLALTQETYHVGVAPNELRDPAADGALISQQLRLSPAAWAQALRKRYAYFAGPFSALEVQALRGVRGVHLEPLLNRFYPAPELARATIGRVGDDGAGASGLEKTLDSLLAGRPGAAVVLKDRAGREYESPARVIAQPEAGLDVELTLDAELQEIGQRALDDALRRMDADGGDVVMLDPATGEVLALASHQRDGAARPSAFTDTFEPGSIAKIFAAAALLTLGRVSPADRVSGEGGRWRAPGRTITDEEPLASLTLADAISVSSNIALAKFVMRLEPEEQFATLRDFGFGAVTGIEFPAEAAGRLRLPAEWSRPSAASLAMGYELSVTPIQVAAAYAALADDGVLLQPTLIREVQRPSGVVLYRHRPEPVRRAVPPAVAVALRDLLRGVVEHGTGTEAALTTFPVAAKTGTARRVVNGHYAPGQYTASFAALFPADHPQLVLVVKIDNPHKGSYFAAQTAAPVTRSMLEQALAARTVALDRARLSTAAPRAAAAPLEDDGGVVPYVVTWPYRPDSAGAGGGTVAAGPRSVVPDVAGLGMRAAVRALHRRGFRVALKGWGAAHHTWPAAGDSAALGSTVTLFAVAPQPGPAAPAPSAPPVVPPPPRRPRRR
jgi:cell division protein FtsI (penicillin-binding protein 3)